MESFEAFFPKTEKLRLYDVKREILGVINMVGDSTYRTLLVMRYIRFMKWEEIAEEMHYTYKWIHILHKRAIKEIQIRTM